MASFTPPPPFLLALRLEDEPCLVVGAGHVAARKAEALLGCGARLTVVAPEVGAEMEELVASARARGAHIVIERRPYRSGEVAGFRLAITATGRPGIDAEVFSDGEAAGVLVNAADNPESCAFYLPAVFRQGDVSVAVSTGGVSPYLAGWVRRRVEGVLGPEVAVLARLVGEARAAVRRGGVPTESLDWEGFVDGRLWPLVESGDLEGARREVESFVASCLGG